jgi:hypothetical protein
MCQQNFILLDLLTLEAGNPIPSDDASYASRIPNLIHTTAGSYKLASCREVKNER